jgi:hypothetical protein
MTNLRRERNVAVSKDQLQIWAKGEFPIYAQAIPSVSKEISVIIRIKKSYTICTGTIEHHILEGHNLPVEHGPME